MNDPSTLQPQPAPAPVHPEAPRSTPGAASTSEPARNGSRDAARQLQLQRAVVAAQDEREQYRRVLAAAIANEKNAKERVGESQREAEAVRNLLSRAELSRGVAEGRVRELERDRTTLEARTELLEHELIELRDEVMKERKRNAQDIESARTRVAFLEAQLEAVRAQRNGFAFTTIRLRARILLVAGIACYLLSLGFFTQLAMELLKTELPPFRLLAVTFGLFVIGALLHRRAAHALTAESAESAS
ncbi:MAG: hypothetical protein WD226_11525 [Planctomycetota bacterium]